MRRSVVIVLAAVVVVGGAALLPIRTERHRYPGSVVIVNEGCGPGYRTFRVSGLDETAPEGWPLALMNTDPMVGFEDRAGTVVVRRPLIGAPTYRLDFDDGPAFPLAEVAVLARGEC